MSFLYFQAPQRFLKFQTISQSADTQSLERNKHNLVSLKLRKLATLKQTVAWFHTQLFTLPNENLWSSNAKI